MRLSFVKTSEFRGGFEPPKPPPRYATALGGGIAEHSGVRGCYDESLVYYFPDGISKALRFKDTA
jgi:hypothetical protein